MTFAILLAGGIGSRTEQLVPKQFLTVNDIPIIVYTLMNLQSNPNIDEIVVVCQQGWDSFVLSYAKQFSVSKLKGVIPGGATRSDSILNGLKFLSNSSGDSKVLLMDANRPLVPQNVIDDVISLVDSCDCSMTMLPCYDSMFVSINGQEINNVVNRTELYKGFGPECAKLSTLLEIHTSPCAKNAIDTSTAGLAINIGKKVLSVRGNNRCFKITTAEDFELFKMYLTAEPQNNIIRRTKDVTFH